MIYDGENMKQIVISIEDIASIVTAVVAVAAFLLSVYNFYIGRRDKKPRLVASISNGFLTYGSELSELMILLEIANPGEKSVKVSAVEIAWKKQAIVFIRGIKGTRDIPFELQPGDSAKFWTPMKEVASSLKEQGCTGKENIRSLFKNAVGGKYLSKKFKIDVNS
jgi:hypothetical protein